MDSGREIDILGARRTIQGVLGCCQCLIVTPGSKKRFGTKPMPVRKLYSRACGLENGNPFVDIRKGAIKVPSLPQRPAAHHQTRAQPESEAVLSADRDCTVRIRSATLCIATKHEIFGTQGMMNGLRIGIFMQRT
jgi:hypothetical protein